MFGIFGSISIDAKIKLLFSKQNSMFYILFSIGILLSSNAAQSKHMLRNLRGLHKFSNLSNEILP